ncbi:MAG: hypothetical protein IT462_12630 [Planctomycetes bacterium]|nr:hypothetical protein [Planctomycetota bacterium]
MRSLLLQLLTATTEVEVKTVLTKANLWDDWKLWPWIGQTPNNQSVVLAQQSTPAAAMVEKITNSIDAILIRKCKEAEIDPRSDKAPKSMEDAISAFIGRIENERTFAEENLLVIGTGQQTSPCISVYDNGEGQLAENFPKTFCSLIHSQGEASSYKGGIHFVQGKFGMGSTGILPFCGKQHHFQLVVSRRPLSLQKANNHEWAFTVFRFDDNANSPAWRYLTGDGVRVLTAGSDSLGLLPKKGAAGGEICDPYERKVQSGTLIKMYEYAGAQANICGDPFTPHLEQFLLSPKLPISVVECRPNRKAKVMRVTVWNRLGTWEAKDKIEPEFSPAPTISIVLTNGEEIPGELRVFRKEFGTKKDGDTTADKPVAGLRALINGQVHAKRDANFFSTLEVDKDQIAGSLLVTLDCSHLSPKTRGELFMSNRELFRDGDILKELMGKLKAILRTNDDLIAINKKRYEEQMDSATKDVFGVKVLEELLSSDPTLADMFGGEQAGSVTSPIPGAGPVVEAKGKGPFVGKPFPSFINSRDGGQNIEIDVPQGSQRLAIFYTDVVNDYLTRRNHRAQLVVTGDEFKLYQGRNLNKGRFAFTLKAPKEVEIGAQFNLHLRITDGKGSGPFELKVNGRIVEPVPVVAKPARPKKNGESRPDKNYATPSSPDVHDRDDLSPDDPPIKIVKKPESEVYVMFFNKKSALLENIAKTRPPEERKRVEFVFKWGLALVCMSLIDHKKQQGILDSQGVEDISKASFAIGKVIVPICLTLPEKLPSLKGSKRK